MSHDNQAAKKRPLSSGPVMLGIGIDIGDRKSEVCVYSAGKVLERFKAPSTVEGIRLALEKFAPARVAIEAGTHSPWMSRLLEELGFEVYVANTRRLKAISSNARKSDRNDAELLAKLVASDPSLLFPIQHRSAAHDAALAVVKTRDLLVKARCRMVVGVRSLVKSTGERMKKSTPAAFATLENDVPEALRTATAPVFATLRVLNRQIDAAEDQLEQIATVEFPDALYVRQVPGIGLVTSVALVLAIGDPGRFSTSRDVGAYFGLVPRRDQSGTLDKSLGISKTGNELVRRLLVQSAHYILGPFGPDSDLRRWGLAQIERRGKKGKKVVVVAVARKLAVLAHRLLRDRATWNPFHNSQQAIAKDGPPSSDEPLPNSRSTVTARGALTGEASSSPVAGEIAAPPVRIPACTEGGPLTKSADRSTEPGKAHSTPATSAAAPEVDAEKAPLRLGMPPGA